MEPKQLRFFDPDNPPQAWTKEEGNAKLDEIKRQMQESQLERIRQHNVRKQRV